MKISFLLIFLLIVPVSCTQIKTKPITEFSQKDLENAVLVDVRTPEEFQEGHLENAMNINWFDEDFLKQFDTIDKGQTIYVYCEIGGRSAEAAQFLEASGYKKVIDLLGGYDAIKEKKQE